MLACSAQVKRHHPHGRGHKLEFQADSTSSVIRGCDDTGPHGADDVDCTSLMASVEQSSLMHDSAIWLAVAPALSIPST